MQLLLGSTLVLFASVAPLRTGEDPALTGLDPVALCEGKEAPGSQDMVETWGRFTYRFASEANRRRFVVEPERWAVHDGRIYVFASDGCREGFLSELTAKSGPHDQRGRHKPRHCTWLRNA